MNQYFASVLVSAHRKMAYQPSNESAHAPMEKLLFTMSVYLCIDTY